MTSKVHAAVVLALGFVSLAAQAQGVPATPTPTPTPAATPVVAPPAAATEAATPAAPAAPEEEKKRWRFGAGVGFNSRGVLAFPHTKYRLGGSAVDNADLKYKVDPSATVMLEGIYMKRNGWGFNIGIGFDTERALKDEEAESSLGNVSGRSIDAKISTFGLYGNVFYRWDRFYIPFGISAHGVSIKNPPAVLSGLTGGRGGGQVGLGYFVTDWMAIELMARSIGVQAKEQLDFGGIVDAREGTLVDGQLNIKAYF